jgi:Ni,Fe-hydrogenase I large subunit
LKWFFLYQKFDIPALFVQFLLTETEYKSFSKGDKDMSSTVTISPLTRIEGHLAIHTQTEKQADGAGLKITQAWCEGEMFRGIETILQGRDPLDAQQIVQRICGVCPISHGIASIQAQEMAYGITPSHNGRLTQNLIFAANYLQSHILHFYHLAALDFVDIKAILKYNGSDVVLKSLRLWVENAVKKNVVFAGAPFLPRYEVNQYVQSDEANWHLISSYVQALNMRSKAHEMAAVFGAKLPHSTALFPGGTTGLVTLERVLTYRSHLENIQSFIENVYLPDLFTAAGAFPDYWNIGQSYNNYLSYGVFRMEERTGENIKTFFPAGAVINGKYEPLNSNNIHEHVKNSRYSSASDLHPYEGKTTPNPDGGYSWLKAPRYNGNVMQVGPLSRVMVTYLAPGNQVFKDDINSVLETAKLPAEKLNSVLGRHLARGLEAKWIAAQCHKWLDELELDKPAGIEFSIPQTGRGYGLTEAPRGALGHWLIIDDYKIKNYQCVVPTTWNCSPRDDRDQPGAVEKALEGTLIKDPEQPIEVGRVVRSFDPCIACAVH